MNGSLSVIAILGFACLLIERIFYWKSRYKKKNSKPSNPGNPSQSERIGILENEVKNIKEDNKEDHVLMRGDIKKIFNLINEMRK